MRSGVRFGALTLPPSSDGTTFTEPTAILGYNSPLPNMPAFCRFGAYIHTSNTSKVGEAYAGQGSS